MFVPYSTERNAVKGSTHKGTVSINISCWSFSLVSLWLKLLITCYDYCKRQQVILAEMSLHTDEWSGKYALSRDLNLQSRNLFVASISYTFTWWSVMVSEITLRACNCAKMATETMLVSVNVSLPLLSELNTWSNEQREWSVVVSAIYICHYNTKMNVCSISQDSLVTVGHENEQKLNEHTWVHK